MKKKPLKRKKRKLKKSSFFPKFKFFSILLSLLALVVILSFSHKVTKPSHKITQLVQKIIISPTLIPSPTSIPTPENVGFCVYAPVILYHHIEPLDQAKKENHAQLTVDVTYFEQHLRYLSENGYKTITADDLVTALVNHTSLPAKPVVITLDDGYSDIYSYAFPLAKKYNMILNLAIPSGLIGNTGYLTWNELKEMINSGLIYVYNHSWSHFSLPSGDISKIKYEIETARVQLEQYLGKPAGRVFFYPYGTFDGKTIDQLKTDGYIAAFSTISSYTQCDSTMFALRRTHIGNAPLSSYGL